MKRKGTWLCEKCGSKQEEMFKSCSCGHHVFLEKEEFEKRKIAFEEGKIEFQFNDGGRKEAGFKGTTGDCVTRAIAIATGKPYKEVYDAINELGKREYITKKKKSKSNSRTGVYKQTIRRYMEGLGWKWTPTMFIGSGCKVHLRKDELPSGVLLLSLSRHSATVINGVLHDTYDCSRNGTRCVYGYFSKE